MPALHSAKKPYYIDYYNTHREKNRCRAIKKMMQFSSRDISLIVYDSVSSAVMKKILVEARRRTHLRRDALKVA